MVFVYLPPRDSSVTRNIANAKALYAARPVAQNSFSKELLKVASQKRTIRHEARDGGTPGSLSRLHTAKAVQAVDPLLFQIPTQRVHIHEFEQSVFANM